MIASENLITLSILGFESENGHVRADEFLDELTDLLTVLNGFDRLAGKTGRPALYYRIIDAHHGSPLSFTLEPVLRPKVRKPARNHIQVLHARFFRELNAIYQDAKVSPDIDDQILERLHSMTAGTERGFRTVRIVNNRSGVDLDKTFETNLRKLMDQEYASEGHEEGALDTANIHGYTRRFWIYPRVGAQKIRCDFLAGEADRIREALGQYIRVEGTKYFRPTSPYPYRISVKDFEIIPDMDQVHLKDLRGIARGATGELGSVEFIRGVRNEWDE